MEATQEPYSHTCIDAGVDWLTATCKLGTSTRNQFEQLGEAIIEGEREAGVEIKPASLRDYRGFRVDGVFSGRRSEDSILVVSGSHAPAHWASIARLASNVSRLDIQATVWTHGEQPPLSRWYYARAIRQPNKRGRPRSYSLVRTHPAGDTLYVGKRQSDYYGRVYDYATAHKKGPPRTLWRYEVELKRQVASAYSRTLLSSDTPRISAEQLVHRWYYGRGLVPTWALQESPHSEEVLIERSDRDTLRWFETALSKTVASAVSRHGLQPVLDALGLSGLVMVKSRKGGAAYASYAAPVVPDKNYR
jgi:hypothetical protein